MNNNSSTISQPSPPINKSFRRDDSQRYEGRGKKFFKEIDIFKFLPHPTTDEVSTSESQLGAIIMIFLILCAVGWRTYILSHNNQPRISSYDLPIDAQIIENSPKFAIGFYSGINLDNLIYDLTYFDYQIIQYQVSIDSNGNSKVIENQIDIELCLPEWLNLGIYALCPKTQLFLQNYQIQKQPQMLVKVKCVACDPNKQTCKSSEALDLMMASGRFIVFVKVEGFKDYLTGQQKKDSYRIFFNFMVQNLYNRAETIFSHMQYRLRPDFFKRVSTEVYTRRFIKNENQYSSNVNVFFNSKTSESAGLKPYFQWWMTMDENITVIDLSFSTTLDAMIFVGGLGSVLFLVFEFIFLRRNENIFYESKKAWASFDSMLRTHTLREDLLLNSSASNQIQELTSIQLDTSSKGEEAAKKLEKELPQESFKEEISNVSGVANTIDSFENVNTQRKTSDNKQSNLKKKSSIIKGWSQFPRSLNRNVSFSETIKDKATAIAKNQQNIELTNGQKQEKKGQQEIILSSSQQNDDNHQEQQQKESTSISESKNTQISSNQQVNNDIKGIEPTSPVQNEGITKVQQIVTQKSHLPSQQVVQNELTQETTFPTKVEATPSDNQKNKSQINKESIYQPPYQMNLDQPSQDGPRTDLFQVNSKK